MTVNSDYETQTNIADQPWLDLDSDICLDDFEFDLRLHEFDPNELDLVFTGLPQENLIEMRYELKPISNSRPSIEDDAYDIPTDPTEWLVRSEKSKSPKPPNLYQFLLLLLHNNRYKSYASYSDKQSGIFKLHQPEKVADLWEQVKNRECKLKMTYNILARGVRDYYKSDIMQKTNTRHTFRFSQKTLREPITLASNKMYVALGNSENP